MHRVFPDRRVAPLRTIAAVEAGAAAMVLVHEWADLPNSGKTTSLQVLQHKKIRPYQGGIGGANVITKCNITGGQ